MSPALNPRGYAARRSRRMALAGLAALALASLVLLQADPGALCALPALGLPLLLALRRYPGEHVLSAFSPVSRQRGSRSRSARCPAARARRAVPRGGLLLAFSLAVRPPPLRLSAAS